VCGGFLGGGSSVKKFQNFFTHGQMVFHTPLISTFISTKFDSVFLLLFVLQLSVLHHFDFHLGSLFWVHVSSFSCDARDDDEGNANAVVVIIIVLLLLLFDDVVVVVVVVAKLVSPFCFIIEREKKPKKKEYYDDEAEKATP